MLEKGDGKVTHPGRLGPIAIDAVELGPQKTVQVAAGNQLESLVVPLGMLRQERFHDRIDPRVAPCAHGKHLGADLARRVVWLEHSLERIPPFRCLEKRAMLIHDIPEDQVEAEIIEPDGHPIGIELFVRQEHVEQPVIDV